MRASCESNSRMKKRPDGRNIRLFYLFCVSLLVLCHGSSNSSSSINCFYCSFWEVYCSAVRSIIGALWLFVVECIITAIGGKPASLGNQHVDSLTINCTSRFISSMLS